MTDDEVFAEFEKRFRNTKISAKIMEYAHHNSVSTAINRGDVEARKLFGEYWVISLAEVERYAKVRPRKGGRPKKERTNSNEALANTPDKND